MEENRIRSILAEKLTAYRKRAGMTQAELAEKLNYSDKSISKWERGDGIPDILVLCRLADLYDVPLDAFLREGALVRPQAEQRGRHIMITLLSLGLVVFISAIAFFVCYLAKVRVGWLSFVYAVPVGMIPALILAAVLGFETAPGSAVGTMFLSFGNAFLFGGLLFSMPGEARFEEFERNVRRAKTEGSVR